jgi:hypothetical protein
MNHLVARGFAAGAGAQAPVNDRHQQQTRDTRNGAVDEGMPENFFHAGGGPGAFGSV